MFDPFHLWLITLFGCGGAALGLKTFSMVKMDEDTSGPKRPAMASPVWRSRIGLRLSRDWRLAMLVSAAIASLLAVFLLLPPIAQDPAYHDFADQRGLWGVPNFFNVASNAAFLLVGALGLRRCLRTREEVRPDWIVFFASVGLVAFGSGYYHWNPSDATLTWDRLPMAVGFVALCMALLRDYTGARTGRLLVPALLLGAASVAVWRVTGDLRFYGWVQGFALISVLLFLLLYRGRYSHEGWLLVALGWYLLAKAAEFSDEPLFALTGGSLSGHTIKHLLAAAASGTVLVVIARRRPAGWR